MTIIVEYNGIVAEVCGTDKELIKAVTTLSTLNEVLYEKYPGLNRYRFTTAVNGVIETGEKTLVEGDKVSLLPPLPGG